MADKVEQPKEVDEVVEKTKAVVDEKQTAEDDSSNDKVENGNSNDKTAENGDAKDDEEDAKDEKEENDSKSEEKPAVKRKSTGGGDATDNAASVEPTPEKKAKTAESTDSEAKDAAKVAA